MKKVFNDVPYHTFSFFSDMIVICPQCGNAGVVHYDRNQQNAVFKCESCYIKKEYIMGEDADLEVNAQCTTTKRFFRVMIANNKIHGQKIRVECPYCKEFVIGNVSDTVRSQTIVFQDMRHAEDPFFHYSLYFQTSYRGETIWALNREHLQYLIDYISADIRTVPPDFYEANKTMRSQSDILPAFMKTAKNRDGIVKSLKKLQLKK